MYSTAIQDTPLEVSGFWDCHGSVSGVVDSSIVSVSDPEDH